MKRALYMGVAMALLALCSGCVAAAVGVGAAGAGIGTYSYIKGELEASYNMPIKQLWPHTLAAMQDLRLTVDVERMDALGGRIDARRVDGTRVKIRLEPENDQVTRIGVRVGTFGSREKSVLIHDAIRKRLGI